MILASLLMVARIWDAAPHNAFTDLIRYRGEWVCAFREGSRHVSPDGAIRVITSRDGKQWSSAARLSLPALDLRDPKLTVTPRGELMLTTAAADRPKEPVSHQSMVWFSRDARQWSEPVKAGELNFWLWRVQWHKGLAYSVGYGTTNRDTDVARLYRSADGRTFEPWVPRLFTEGYPNETSLLFEKDGTARMLLRRDRGTMTGQWGTSRPPYKEWTWQDMGVRIGGPHMLQIPGGRVIGVVRLYDGKQRTSIVEINPATGKLTELEKLPSNGDSSYAGLVWEKGELWISYYSSHEEKTAIYLARWKP